MTTTLPPIKLATKDDVWAMDNGYTKVRQKLASLKGPNLSTRQRAWDLLVQWIKAVHETTGKVPDPPLVNDDNRGWQSLRNDEVVFWWDWFEERGKDLTLCVKEDGRIEFWWDINEAYRFLPQGEVYESQVPEILEWLMR